MMLQINHLSFALKKDLRTLVEDLTFTLGDGDKAVIIGEEGNGKSTLLKLVYDAALAEDYTEWEGEIVKNGLRMGYLPQELPKQHQKETVYEYLCGLEGFLLRSPAELSEAAVLLGLPPEMLYSDQTMGTLSGGERVKIQLAGLLCEQPDLFLLDEPSNDIDIPTLEWLETFINGCEKPVLFVSHDETLIENTANMVLHLEQLRRKTLPRHTVARVPYREYIDRRLSAFAHQEQVARWERDEYQRKEDRWRVINAKVEHNVDTYHPCASKHMKVKMNAMKVQERRLEKEHETLTQMPEAEESILPKFSGGISLPNGKTVLDFSLAKLEAGGRVLAQNLALEIRGPAHVCIVGKNGAGKTTMLRLIADALLQRQDLKAAYMPQNYEESLDLSVTPVEFLAPSGKKEEITRARTFLGSMKYTADEMGHSAQELSGGQKAKLLFLDMILKGCNVLLLDEPTRNFSPLSNPVIRQVLQDFPGCIISVSHDRKYISQVCQTHYLLSGDGLEIARDAYV